MQNGGIEVGQQLGRDDDQLLRVGWAAETIQPPLFFVTAPIVRRVLWMFLFVRCLHWHGDVRGLKRQQLVQLNLE